MPSRTLSGTMVAWCFVIVAGDAVASRLDAQIEMGWFPLLDASQRFVIGPNDPPHVQLHGAPCGPVWLRVSAVSEAGGNRAPRTCRGADSEGRLLLADSRQTPHVRCDLGSSCTAADPASPQCLQVGYTRFP